MDDVAPAEPGRMERGGNTKTHGIVRGEFIALRERVNRAAPSFADLVRGVDALAGAEAGR